MKKTISIVLLLLIVLSSSIAYAENISLPAGLKFGMSISEAVAVSGFSKSSLPAYLENYIDARDLFFMDECISGEVSIGGLDAQMTALFDLSGLKQVKYSFITGKRTESSGIDDEIMQNYTFVEDSLQQKYGEGLNPSVNKHMYMPLIDEAMEYPFTYTLFGNRTTTWEKVYSLSPTLRLISCEDGSSVYIDHYVQVRSDKYGDMQTHYLTYTYYDFSVDTNVNTNTSIGF